MKDETNKNNEQEDLVAKAEPRIEKYSGKTAWQLA